MIRQYHVVVSYSSTSMYYCSCSWCLCVCGSRCTASTTSTVARARLLVVRSTSTAVVVVSSNDDCTVLTPAANWLLCVTVATSAYSTEEQVEALLP